jgi:hypothetical protein
MHSIPTRIAGCPASGEPARDMVTVYRTANGRLAVSRDARGDTLGPAALEYYDTIADLTGRVPDELLATVHETLHRSPQR